MTESQKNFINTIAPMAVKAMKKTGVLASLTISQAILESGWGKSGLTLVSNNLFGIKGSYKGQSVNYPTKEWVSGQYVSTTGRFKKYPSWEESVNDHADIFVRLERYHNLLGVTDYKEACRLVKKDGYATSPTYTETLISIIETYNLMVYDSASTNKLYTFTTGYITGNDISSFIEMAEKYSLKFSASLKISPVSIGDLNTLKELANKLELKDTEMEEI